jgi:hypothetical protein
MTLARTSEPDAHPLQAPPAQQNGQSPPPETRNGPRVSPRAVVRSPVTEAAYFSQSARIASISKATMLVILIIGFTAGPAVSL